MSPVSARCDARHDPAVDSSIGRCGYHASYMGESSLEPHPREIATPSTNIKRRAVRGGLATLGGQAIKLVLGLATTAVMARILAPQDYGAVAMVVAFLGLATLFRDLGLSAATVQRERITHDEVSGLFWVNVATGSTLMVIMMLCAPLIVSFYHRPDLYWLTIAYASLTPINSLGAQHSALLERSMRYGSLAGRDLVAAFAGAFAGILSAALGLGYWAIFTMQAVTTVVGTMTLWWQSAWIPGPPQHPRKLAPLLAFGGALTLSNLLAFVARGLDSLLLGRFVGAVGLGLYTRAQNILLRPLEQVIPPVMNVATGTFARLAATPERFIETAFRFLGVLAFTAGLAVALVVGTAHWIVALLLGPQWTDAVPLVRALAPFALVEPCASLLGTLLVVRGHPLKLARWRVVSTAIILAGLFVGLPWGPLGVAVAMSGTGLLLRTPLFFVYSSQVLGLSSARLFRTVGPHALCGLLVAASLLALNQAWPLGDPFVGLITHAAVGTALYLGLALAWAGGRTTMRDLFASTRALRHVEPRS